MRDYLLYAPVSQLKVALERRFKAFDNEGNPQRKAVIYAGISEVLAELKKRGIDSNEISPLYKRLFDQKRKRRKRQMLKNYHRIGRYGRLDYPAPSGIVC